MGFCYLGCWLNPKGLGWIRGWKPECLAHSKETYEQLQRQLQTCLAETDSVEGLSRLRLWENRCGCSAVHLQAISELKKIAAFADDAHPENLTDAQKQLVREHCARALDCCSRYEKLHIRQMPDRGCEGTIVSYCATIPVYIDHVLQYFAEGETVCTHQPASLDAPPPPDTAFFN